MTIVRELNNSTQKKTLIFSTVGFFLGCICGRFLFLLAGALVGAGHGIDSPFSISGAPGEHFYFMIPVAVAAIFSYWRPAILCGLAMFVVHYVANIVNWRNIAGLPEDYLYIHNRGSGVFWGWLVFYVFLNALVWTIGLRRLAVIRRK